MRRRIRYRITRGGALFCLAAVLVGAAAGISANNLLFLVLSAMISTLLVSGFISRLCLAGMELDLLLPEHISARRAIAARLYVRNLKVWMPSFSIHVTGIPESDAKAGFAGPGAPPPILTSGVYFPVVPGGAVLDEAVELRFEKRGTYRQNSFIFSTRFPFGFFEKSALVRLRREVLVYPCIEPQPGFEELLAAVAGEIEAHVQGLGRDFHRIRPYEALESARYMDWKATAHTRSLQVREFAREQERTVEIFLDRDVPPGMEEWFERAVECCAFLAWRLSRQDTSIRLCSQDFEFRLPEDGEIHGILKYLALVYPQPGKPPEPPADDGSYQILLSAAPGRFAGAGWAPGRTIGPDWFTF